MAIVPLFGFLGCARFERSPGIAGAEDVPIGPANLQVPSWRIHGGLMGDWLMV